jgi:hypothetical protein
MNISLQELKWIMLIHQLPPKPTNLRVRTWRKLQKLGAVAVKNSVYVLPFNEKTFEDFQWLKQEIETAGGEADVFRAGSVEGRTDDEIIASFRQQRDEEYAQVTAELEALYGAIREQQRGGHLTLARLAQHESDLTKQHAELERIAGNDFFGAPGHARAQAAYEKCQKALLASREQGKPAKAASGSAVDSSAALDTAQYQGRRWVTRRNLHIDRLASAWLIRRFIDQRPRFYFVEEGESVEDGIAFDMFGAEFTHQGEDCTFETLTKRFGLTSNKALQGIAEMVHDIDLKDNKFNRLEAAGLNAAVLGLSVLLKDDRKLVQQCYVIFDGLYALLSKDTSQVKGKKDSGRKQIKRRDRKREPETEGA